MKRLKWKLGSVYLEIVLILMQDRCTVSRVSVRGTLTDAHNEVTRAQIEALNSTF